jgi:hypothetical protein
VNLSASVYWVPEGSSSYLNYGAGISEVCQISSQMSITYSIHSCMDTIYLTSSVQNLLKNAG